MNKRPPGTRILSKKEHDTTLETLNAKKRMLEEGIENMSVTLYTGRAQNQMRGFVDRMNEVDRALNVFERDRVYIKD
jgi:hypothetical protein